MPPHRRIDVVLDSIKRLQRIGASANLLNLLQKQHPADLAEVINELSAPLRNAVSSIVELSNDDPDDELALSMIVGTWSVSCPCVGCCWCRLRRLCGGS